MCHFVIMTVFDDADHLREELSCIILAEVSLPGEPVKELASFTITEWIDIYSSTMK